MKDKCRYRCDAQGKLCCWSCPTKCKQACSKKCFIITGEKVGVIDAPNV